MAAEEIRSKNDRDMFETLSKDRTVRRVNEAIARHEADNPFRTRRRLLATAVRLSRRMAPTFYRASDACVEALGLDIEVENFVFSSPTYNAMCFKPEDDRLLVMFASSLLEDFSDDEVKFVVGHELGHHVYRHHDIPIGMILRGAERPSPRLAMALFAWSRYAEISADRAGAFCSGSLDADARALFKLASGLSGQSISFHLDDFLAQVDQMQLEDQGPGMSTGAEDWFSTHPFSPLRVKALKLFHDGVMSSSLKAPTDELELDVQRLMGMMEPDYLDAKTESAEAMRRLLFAGSIVVAASDGQIEPHEVEAFEEFFGKGAFRESFNVDALRGELTPRAERVVELTSNAQRMQVIHDLCVVARAGGHAGNNERRVLVRIATDLDISSDFVERSLDQSVDPD